MIITVEHPWAKRYAVVGLAKTAVQISMSRPYDGPDWYPAEISVMYAHSLNKEDATQLAQNLLIAQIVAEAMERWPDVKTLGITIVEGNPRIYIVGEENGAATEYAE